MAGPSVRTPASDQEMALLEADSQGLIQGILESFPPKVNCSKIELCTQKEGELPKAFIECFIPTFQKTHSIKLGSPRALGLLSVCCGRKSSP